MFADFGRIILIESNPTRIGLYHDSYRKVTGVKVVVVVWATNARHQFEIRLKQ